MNQAAMNQPVMDPPSRVARLNWIAGAVSFQPAGVDDWTNASVNYPMTTGDHLFADQGARAEMHIGANALRLNAVTNFGFLNLDDRTAQVQLTQGSLHVRLRDIPDSDVWEIDTPNGAITLLRTGDYRIDTDPNRNATMLTVLAGDAEVSAGGTGFTVHARQTAFFSGDGSQPDVRSQNDMDDFDDFCFSRDRREDSLQSPRYVSREMVGYEDLDGNGTWTEDAQYGPVWRPRVAAGWVPYHDGHWAWVEPWGWTWIDAAPWGFAPFHYGRWAYVGGGWGWCPGPRAVVGVGYARPVYAPALVAFVGGGGWSASLRFGGGGGVAWFPLGFNEPYVPAYHVSERYVRQVNVTNVTVYNNVTVVNNNFRYANQSVPGAIVAVPRQAFVGAQRVDRVAVAAPAGTFAGARVGGYTAEVAPERSSVIRPANGNVPRPSAAVMNRQVVARVSPPPPPVAFAARQQALQANGGRPLAPQQVQAIRQTSAPAQQPAVRMARPVTAVPAPRPVYPTAPSPNQQPPQRPITPAPAQDRMSSRPPQVQAAPVAPPARPVPQTAPTPPQPQMGRPRQQPEARPVTPPPPERSAPQPEARPVAPQPPARPVPQTAPMPQQPEMGRPRQQPEARPAAPQSPARPEAERSRSAPERTAPERKDARPARKDEKKEPAKEKER